MHLYGSSEKFTGSMASEHAPDIIRAVVMGSAGVGKTALIKQCLHQTFIHDYKETVEDTFYYSGDNFELEILDTSGSYNFPDMVKLAMQEGDVFVLVFSVEDYITFDCVSQLRKEIIDLRGPEVPIIVVGNKSDCELREVPNALADTVVSIEWGCSYHDVNAKDVDASTDVFNDVLNQYPALYGEKICVQNKSDVTLRKHEVKRSNKKTSKLRTSLTSIAKKIKSIKHS